MAVFAALEVCVATEYQTAQTTILFDMHRSSLFATLIFFKARK